MAKVQMYLRMVIAALVKRKSRVTIALLAITLGTGVISGLLNVYYDINLKMSKEMRRYGANLAVVPADQGLEKGWPEEDLAPLASLVSEKGNLLGYAPYLYRIVGVDQARLVLVGTWLDQVPKVSPYWQVTGRLPSDRRDAGSAVVGQAVATRLKLQLHDMVTVVEEETGKTSSFRITGIVKTGSTEDNQIFVSLQAAQNLAGRPGMVNLAYFSLMAKSEEVENLVTQAKKVFPHLEVRPIKQISQSEGKILDKIKTLVYLVVVIIFLSTLLCVSITMMFMVLERRKEIGLSKALGAQNESIIKQFLGESIVLGLFGGLAGVALGYGFAQIIGQSVFAGAISFRPVVLLVVCGLSVLVSALASLLPVKLATGIEPALVLKGE